MVRFIMLITLAIMSLAAASSEADSEAQHPSDLYAHMLASAASAVEYGEPAIVAPVVNTQYHAQDELGRYEYGYSNPTASKVERKNSDGTVEGTYSYVSPDGRIITNNYVSDAWGFKSSLAPSNGKPVGQAVVPVAPEVPVGPAPVVPVAPEVPVNPVLVSFDIGTAIAEADAPPTVAVPAPGPEVNRIPYGPDVPVLKVHEAVPADHHAQHGVVHHVDHVIDELPDATVGFVDEPLLAHQHQVAHVVDHEPVVPLPHGIQAGHAPHAVHQVDHIGAAVTQGQIAHPVGHVAVVDASHAQVAQAIGHAAHAQVAHQAGHAIAVAPHAQIAHKVDHVVAAAPQISVAHNVDHVVAAVPQIPFSHKVDHVVAAAPQVQVAHQVDHVVAATPHASVAHDIASAHYAHAGHAVANTAAAHIDHPASAHHEAHHVAQPVQHHISLEQRVEHYPIAVKQVAATSPAIKEHFAGGAHLLHRQAHPTLASAYYKKSSPVVKSLSGRHYQSYKSPYSRSRYGYERYSGNYKRSSGFSSYRGRGSSYYNRW